MKKDRSIAVLLIIVSLASLVGLMIPTFPVTSTSISETTHSAYTATSSITGTATISWDINPEYIAVNGITSATSVNSYAMVGLCGSPFSVFAPVCTGTATLTKTYMVNVTNPAQVIKVPITETSEVGYLPATGTRAIPVVLLVIALLLVGVELLIRGRKAVKVQ
ncbi:MAG: hypothetical protein ACLP5V_03055 [Candidatus Bathyarchaeia archaeon]